MTELENFSRKMMEAMAEWIAECEMYSLEIESRLMSMGGRIAVLEAQQSGTSATPDASRESSSVAIETEAESKPTSMTSSNGSFLVSQDGTLLQFLPDRILVWPSSQWSRGKDPVVVTIETLTSKDSTLPTGPASLTPPLSGHAGDDESVFSELVALFQAIGCFHEEAEKGARRMMERLSSPSASTESGREETR